MTVTSHPPLLCSSTSRTLLPKLLRGAGTQLLFHGRGRTAKSMPDSSLLPAPVCPPDKVSWAWMEVGGGRERFLISTEVCCCQQPPSAASYTNSVPSRSLFPPKTTQIVFTNTPCACALTGSMWGERFRKRKVCLHILWAPFPLYSALSIRNILTQKPVSIKVLIPWTFKDKAYLITGALRTEI